MDKFFNKDYDCTLNVSSTEEKKVFADCFKEIHGVDEPKSYQGQKDIMCKNLADGKILNTYECEDKKLGKDANKARDQKKQVSFCDYTTP